MTSQLQMSYLTLEPGQPALATMRHLNRGVSDFGGLQAVESVPGLHFLPVFLTPEQEADCVRRIDAAEGQWRNDLRRRVQHYGWRYDYKARAITPDMRIGALPDWPRGFATRPGSLTVCPNRSL